MPRDPSKTPGFGWRVSVSIITGVGWLVFLIVWLFFYAHMFSVYQNIAILIVSILVLGGIMAASWASWGMKYGNKYSEKDWECYGKKWEGKFVKKSPRRTTRRTAKTRRKK